MVVAIVIKKSSKKEQQLSHSSLLAIFCGSAVNLTMSLVVATLCFVVYAGRIESNINISR